MHFLTFLNAFSGYSFHSYKKPFERLTHSSLNYSAYPRTLHTKDKITYISVLSFLRSYNLQFYLNIKKVIYNYFLEKLTFFLYSIYPSHSVACFSNPLGFKKEQKTHVYTPPTHEHLPFPFSHKCYAFEFNPYTTLFKSAIEVSAA
jgi:hypothetical protein